MKIVGVIPARYQSSRFPGKPLADICGKPMIWWVYNQAIKVKNIDFIYVATEDSRIEKFCVENNIPVVMTSDKHRNGSERLSEVAQKIFADIYITIQGDEPLLEPRVIEKVIDLILSDESIICATLKTPYRNPVDVVNSTTPKIVCDANDNAILFSRAPIPYPKSAIDYIYYKPIGVYAFKREAILKYGELPMGDVERIEEIELLRFIENDIKIRVGLVDSDTIAVDTIKDLKRVSMIMENRIS